MKNKINLRFFALLFLAGALIITLSRCKNVGPSEWPDPTPDVTSQLKLTVFDSDNGSSLQGYNIKVILPDGTSKDFTNQNGTVNVETLNGTYVVTASKDGYLAQNEIIEIENVTDKEVSATIVQQDFYLNKRGNANVVTPQGTTLTVQTDQVQNTTIQFPYGSISNDQNVVVSFIQPPYKNGSLKVLGEKVPIAGYDFSPDLTFPENKKPIINIPVNVQSVIDGRSPIFLGSFDEQTNTWETLSGTLNESKTMASFEMPHFSAWYTFTGYRLVKTGTSWSPWTYVSESATCSAGACGTFLYFVTPSSLINDLIALGYTINLKVKDTRCVGPHYKYAQQLFARCLLTNYSVYDYTGQLLGNIQIPEKKFQWTVQEYYCHDQGGGK